jgi:RHS repeat-associated protein
MFERVVTSTGTDYRHYIYAGGRPVVVISRNSAGTMNVRSLLVDHQGSISAVVTDQTGALYVGESFTAYGNRRDANTWTGVPTSSDRTLMDGVTREGYTFQTVLGSMGLNHMNGRVQDAVTGRFLSPDPVGTSPYNTQSYNRYNYVGNNPLSYTDPSGFWVFLPYGGDLGAASSSGTLDEQVVTAPRDSPPAAGGDPSLTGGGGGNGGTGNGEGAYGHAGQKSDALDPIQVLGHVGATAPAGSYVSAGFTGAYAVSAPDGGIFGYVATASVSAPARASGIFGSVAQKAQSQKPDPRCTKSLRGNSTVTQNINFLRQLSYMSNGNFAPLVTWLMNVAPGGAWDYKNGAPTRGNDMMGNFNFGATGDVIFPNSPTTILSGAGVVQLVTNPSGSDGGIPFVLPPYGDDALGQSEIQAGIDGGC